MITFGSGVNYYQSQTIGKPHLYLILKIISQWQQLNFSGTFNYMAISKIPYCRLYCIFASNISSAFFILAPMVSKAKEIKI